MINKILSACDFKILTQFLPSLVSDVIQTCCLLSLARSTSCLQGWCHTASWILRGHSHGFTCWILQECQAHTQAQVQVCDHAFVWLHVHSGGQGHVYVWVHAMLFLRSMSVSEPMPIPLPPASHLCPHLSLCPCPLGGAAAAAAGGVLSWTLPRPKCCIARLMNLAQLNGCFWVSLHWTTHPDFSSQDALWVRACICASHAAVLHFCW